MIENTYLMTKNKYLKYTTPKFYALPIFYIYIIIFISALFTLKYFIDNDFQKQYKLLLGFVALVMFYLAFFHKWIVAISQYRSIRKKGYNGKPWECRVVIDAGVIKLYVNSECNNEVNLTEIKKLTIAKSSVALKRNMEADKIILYNDSYKKGNKDTLIDYIKTNYPKIVIEKERFRYDY